MTTTLQLRRGTTAKNAAYTGSVGELTVDTTLNKVILHDGSTAGGITVGNLQGNIQLGKTGANEIDTSSGNLTIDSAGGTVTVDDNLVIAGDLTVQGTTTTVNSTTIDVQNSLRFEGATSDAFETNLTVTDPTADRTITLPNASGTVLLTDGDGSNLTGINTDLVSDTSPQLGGNLDVNGNSITSSSSQNIVLDSAAQVHLDGNSLNSVALFHFGTRYGEFERDSQDFGIKSMLTNANIKITPNGSGNIILDGLTFPNADGSANQVLTTDGAGTLSFTTVSGGASDIDGLSDAIYDADHNLGLGDGATDAITTGTDNIGIGNNAITNITTGTDNIAIGYNSLSAATTHGSNIAIGSQAGESTTAFWNLFIGGTAGRDTTTGNSNVAVGGQSLRQNVTGNQNVAMGRSALMNSTSSGNTSIGYQSLIFQTSGSDNAALGANAMQNLTTGYSNTAVGKSSGSSITTGYNNTFIGFSAQPSSATVNNEITLGNANVTSLRIPGLQSSASSGDVLTFNGTDITLATPSGADPVTSSLNIGNTKTITFDAYFPVGTKNIVWGENAGASLTGGDGNVLIGDNAGNKLVSTNSNIAIGKSALDANVSGAQNTIVGNAAAGACTSGQNTVMGDGAGGAFTSGGDNTLIGRAAGFFGNPSFTTAIGSTAMLTGGGSSCTAVGYGALSGVSGNNNTGVGRDAGDGIGSGSNNTCIGYDSDSSASGVSNQITLGNSSISTLRCQVTSITALSDARDKKDVEDANIGLDFINDLRPVKFVWDTRDGAKKDIKEVGFIAQELDEVQQKHGIEDYLQLVLKDNPDKLEASQGKLIPILVQAIKDLKKEIDELKKA